MSITNVVPRELAGAPPRDLTLAPRRAWQRLSLRAKLLIVFVVIDLIAAFVVGGVTIMRARTSTRVEIAASMRSPKPWCRDDPAGATASSITPLSATCRRGKPAAPRAPVGAQRRASAGRDRTESGCSEKARSGPARAGLVRGLIAPPVERRELPIVANGNASDRADHGVADDEIAEAGRIRRADRRGVALNVAMVIVLFFLFGRVLAPLTDCARPARSRGPNYKVRLARPDARELGAIADRFNSLAQALDMLRAENNELNRRLITAQDDERRHTALELHDEVGPCLFGLKANAASIATLADERPAHRGPRRARARHAGDHRSPADDQSKPVESAAPDGARPRAARRSAGGSGARAARQHPDLRLVSRPARCSRAMANRSI
jgi:two-component system sensor histidine kinase UhpB